MVNFVKGFWEIQVHSVNINAILHEVDYFIVVVKELTEAGSAFAKSMLWII